MKIYICVFDRIAATRLASSVEVGAIAIQIGGGVVLVKAAALQAGIGPDQRIVAERIHLCDSAPIIAAVATGFGTHIGSRERISQDIARKGEALAIGRAGEQALISRIRTGSSK